MSVSCPYCGNPMNYLTLAQTASLLNLSKTTVRKWIRQGKLPGTMPVRGINSAMQYRIPSEVVLPLVRHDD